MNLTKSFFILLTILFFSNQLHAQFVFGKSNKNKKSDLNYSNPKEYEIAEINVRGTKYLDPDALISLSGLRVGDKIKVPSDEFSFAVKKLWKQGIIGDISLFASKVEGDKIYLIIELTERPRLTDFNIVGLNKTHASDLKSKMGLIKGKVLTDVMIKNTELTVIDWLETKGYRNGKVQIKQKSDSILRNSAQIDIIVDKGRKVKIYEINFEGNKNVSSKILKKKLKKTGVIPRLSLPSTLVKTTIQLIKNPKNIKNLFKKKDSIKRVKYFLNQNVRLNIFKKSKYTDLDFQTDKENIISYYNSKGYRDAQIISDSLYNINNKHLNIKIKIYEGTPYYFRNVIWSGNHIYADSTLSKILGISKGDVYDLDLVNKKISFNPVGVDVSSLYMDDGYLFFNVKPVEVKVDGDSIDLEMRIYEGKQATIKEVIIKGNEKTNDHVILRQLNTLPGNKFSRSALIRTQQELVRLGFFSPTGVTPVPIPEPVNQTVDIQWNLEETSNDQIQLSGGWGGAFGFVGTLGFTFKNFSTRNLFKKIERKGFPVGDGQTVAISFRANGRQFNSYSFSFVEPWLGGRRQNAFSISFNRSIQRILLGRNVTGYLALSSVSTGLGRRITWPDDFFFLNHSLTYQYYDFFQYNNRSFGFNTGTSNNIFLSTTLERNSTNSPIYPKAGSRISLKVDLTPPHSLWRDVSSDSPAKEKYKWIEYHKWNFDSRFYTQLAGNIVFASRFHFGHIGAYDSKLGVGPFERFRMGGNGLTGQNFLLGTDIIGLRGYSDNSIEPVSIESKSRRKNNDFVGGTTFTKFVMELRFPISLESNSTIYSLLFLEGGNNWDELSSFNPFALKRSAGVGLRIFLPAFGLFGLDWAYGFDNIPNSTNIAGSRFHFSIGNQIR